MFKRAFTRGAFKGAGFPLLSRVVVRHPLWVIASWIVLAAVLMLSLPSLAKVAADNPPEFLPAESPVLAAGELMKTAFKEPSSANGVVVILSNEKGLTPADEATYRRLVQTLRADTDTVMNTQDFVNIPELKEVMTSKDGKAYNLPVNLTGQMATSAGQKAYNNVIKLVEDTTAGTTLTPSVVGAAATFDDVNKIGARDQLVIETTTGILVFTILVLVYRSVVAMMLPLLTIGAALLVAQQVVAGLGLVGLGVGPQTLLLMTAMMLGAGTDYAIFLLSRYQEIRGTGVPSDEAMTMALTSIGQVIAGSALTVAAAFMGMAFTDLGVFSTVGPPLAVTIMIGFVASVTMLPALMVLAGRRNWLKQRKNLTGRIWRRSGIAIVKHPKTALAGSLAVLLALASCMSLINYNYDDRKNLPDDIDSNLAYENMNRHFPVSSTAQQFLLIQSPGDLRTPEALAAMEQMTQRISNLPGIDAIRGITRPTGEMIEQGKATWQAGEVGTKLGDAATLIDDNEQNLSALTGGADQLADVLDEIRRSVLNAVGSVRGLASALDEMSAKFGGAKTLNEIDKTASLVKNMRSLGKALGFDRVRLGDLGGWAAPVLGPLNTSPTCSADPECVASRADLQRIANLQGDPALDAIAELGDVLVSTDGNQTLDDTLGGLSKNLSTLTTAARELGLNETNGLQKRIDRTIEGANTLADSSRQLAEGVQLLVDQTRNIGSGLDQASAFLMAMKRDAADPPMSGFYIPPEMLTQEEFKKAAGLFISDDGHTARYLVQTELDPFSVEAMDQLQLILKTANDSRPNTMLEDATISMVGFTVVNDNLRTYYNGDIRFIILVTLVVVFLILAVILRAIVAPLYLVASVVLSFVSAVGIGVIFFQFILGQNIHWSVPGTAFLVLVAVGADYNLLLISRIRDEIHLGLRSAVVRTVGATGGVITSAGIIFAVSMLSLTVSSLSTVVQMGFVIGVGLLLDTFIVRTITVPAMAVLAGNANWWPSKSVGKSVAVLHRPVKNKVTTDNDDGEDTDRLPTVVSDDTDHLGVESETDRLAVEAVPADKSVSDDVDTDAWDPVTEELAPVIDEPEMEAEAVETEESGAPVEVAESGSEAGDPGSDSVTAEAGPVKPEVVAEEEPAADEPDGAGQEPSPDVGISEAEVDRSAGGSTGAESDDEAGEPESDPRAEGLEADGDVEELVSDSAPAEAGSVESQVAGEGEQESETVEADGGTGEAESDVEDLESGADVESDVAAQSVEADTDPEAESADAPVETAGDTAEADMPDTGPETPAETGTASSKKRWFRRLRRR
ncbi:MAG: MMPL family transporter [Mycobacterium sp.]